MCRHTVRMRMLKHYLIMPVNKMTARINFGRSESAKYTKRLSKISALVTILSTVRWLALWVSLYDPAAITTVTRMANGCVPRILRLMDPMTDNEIERARQQLGHVSFRHSRKAMQTAYAIHWRLAMRFPRHQRRARSAASQSLPGRSGGRRHHTWRVFSQPWSLMRMTSLHDR